MQPIMDTEHLSPSVEVLLKTTGTKTHRGCQDVSLQVTDWILWAHFHLTLEFKVLLGSRNPRILHRNTELILLLCFDAENEPILK